MRIIAGKHKNRTIPTREAAGYRPSTSKFREALFSILSSGEFANVPAFKDARILDLYAGTGSLGLEALSRGARSITLVDNDRDNMDLAMSFAKKIGEENNVQVIITDANFLPRSTEKYDLVFMDPPYFKNYVAKSLTSLVKNDYLIDGAIIAVEVSRKEDVELIEGISLIKEKIYNNNKLLILRYK